MVVTEEILFKNSLYFIEMEKDKIKSYALYRNAEIELSCNGFIEQLINKAYDYSIEKQIPNEKIDSYIKGVNDNGIAKIYDYYCKKKQPKPLLARKLTQEEATGLYYSIFTFKVADYQDLYKKKLKEKFIDYKNLNSK